jgi:hypothetical protein
MDLFYEYMEQTKKLIALNMLDNPINVNKEFKIIVLSTCPKIVQINEVYINPHVREGFRVIFLNDYHRFLKNKKNFNKSWKEQPKIIKKD